LFSERVRQLRPAFLGRIDLVIQGIVEIAGGKALLGMERRSSLVSVSVCRRLIFGRVPVPVDGVVYDALEFGREDVAAE
jgi:hypothetical protein